MKALQSSAMVVTLLASGVASGSSPAVVIPGGRFDMGCRGCNLVDAVPVHPVEVSSFRMQAKPVSNEDFHKFVAETGYVTIAERAPDPAGFPDIPRHLLVAGSAVSQQYAAPFKFQGRIVKVVFQLK